MNDQVWSPSIKWASASMIGIITAKKRWNCLTSSRSQCDVSILDFRLTPDFERQLRWL
jgi:hypothetical protein